MYCYECVEKAVEYSWSKRRRFSPAQIAELETEIGHPDENFDGVFGPLVIPTSN